MNAEQLIEQLCEGDFSTAPAKKHPGKVVVFQVDSKAAPFAVYRYADNKYRGTIFTTHKNAMLAAKDMSKKFKVDIVDLVK